jgi:predicted membrane-bound dolichyl-phosphate-mannose-protein mannosyltransferase
MYISPLSEKATSSIWNQKELPPGPPMSLDSSWVKSMQQFFPRENADVLAKHASHLLANMMKALSNQIARDTKKNKETAQRMRDAIFGR